MSVAFAEGLAACELAAGPFPPEARRCDWCGADLPKRRRRWCSDACGDAFSRNHAWTNARAAAIARDRVCQRCGSDGRAAILPWYRLLMFLCPEPLPLSLAAWCREAGYFPDHFEARENYRAYRYRLMRPWRNAHDLLLSAQRRSGLEVNHITPCLGAHKENSCAHHLDGEIARGLRLRLQIGDGAPQRVDVVAQQPDPSVAPVAEQPSNEARRVIVIYVRDDLGEAALADGTRVLLALEDGAELLDAEAVEEAQVACLARAAQRAEAGISAPLGPLSAEQARDRLLAASSSVSVLASLRAVETLTPDEIRSALHAGHLTIFAVLGVPRGAMPRPKGGLEVLCHRCHVEETTRQRRAGLLERAAPAA